MKKTLLGVVAMVLLAGCGDGGTEVDGQFKAEVWADNWFSAYVGDSQVAEDSVSMTTERSFNAETFGFNASYPFTLNFVVKDYKENDSGLDNRSGGRQHAAVQRDRQRRLSATFARHRADLAAPCTRGVLRVEVLHP